jgi:hypothetical protein
MTSSQSIGRAAPLTDEDTRILMRNALRGIYHHGVADTLSYARMRRLSRPRDGAWRLGAAHMEERFIQSHHAWVR